MDDIYEWLNPRIPVEYVLISFHVLSVAIVIGMLGMKGSRAKRFVLGALLAEYYFLVLCSTVICRASHGHGILSWFHFGTIPIFGIGWIILLT